MTSERLAGEFPKLHLTLRRTRAPCNSAASWCCFRKEGKEEKYPKDANSVASSWVAEQDISGRWWRHSRVSADGIHFGEVLDLHWMPFLQLLVEISKRVDVLESVIRSAANSKLWRGLSRWPTHRIKGLRLINWKLRKWLTLRTILRQKSRKNFRIAQQKSKKCRKDRQVPNNPTTRVPATSVDWAENNYLNESPRHIWWGNFRSKITRCTSRLLSMCSTFGVSFSFEFEQAFQKKQSQHKQNLAHSLERSMFVVVWAVVVRAMPVSKETENHESK